MNSQNLNFTNNHAGIYGIATKQKADAIQLLCVLKTRGPYLGMWDLPGGTPEKGETLLETLEREVLEETALTVSQASFLCQHQFSFRAKNTSCFCHHSAHLFKIARFSEVAPTTFPVRDPDDPTGEDVAKAQWITVKEISPGQLTPFARLAIFLILDLIEPDALDGGTSPWHPGIYTEYRF